MTVARRIFSRSLILFLVVGALWSASGPSAVAYTPDSPNVKAMVAKARAYLEKSNHDQLGGRCLIALALAKSGVDHSHPKIQGVINEAVAAADNPNQFNTFNQSRNYNLTVTLIFLTEMDAKKYRPQIENMVRYFGSRQQDSGGFGYNAGDPVAHGNDGKTGDTSQTQYVALAVWAVKNSGIEVPQPMVERMCRWLIATQDPGGGWGYQGKIAPNGRVAQHEVWDSLVVAGLSSMYICADLLRAYQKEELKTEPKSDLPSVFESTEPPPVAAQYPTTSLDKEAIKSSCALGDQWIAANHKGYKNAPPPGATWNFSFFYLYGMERYQSFREVVLSQVVAEPDWYNQGVDFLAKEQKQDGSWHAWPENAAVPTALASLFLSRTTKKLIEKNWGSGELRGGVGLPKDLAKARVVDGKIVGEAIAGSVDDLVGILADPKHAGFESLVKNPENLLKQASPEDLKKLNDTLQQLVAEGDYEQRLTVVRLLGKNGNLDDVPKLVYALTDPDWRVVMEARDGLKRISRKFDGFGLRDEPTDEERTEAIQKWKAWYLSIRPHVEFPEIPPVVPSGTGSG